VPGGHQACLCFHSNLPVPKLKALKMAARPAAIPLLGVDEDAATRFVDSRGGMNAGIDFPAPLDRAVSAFTLVRVPS
jgi:hypothetical protein